MTPQVGALMAVKYRHWLVTLIVYGRGEPRFVCFRNGERQTFSLGDFS
jgi:hypothetical protein